MTLRFHGPQKKRRQHDTPNNPKQFHFGCQHILFRLVAFFFLHLEIDIPKPRNEALKAELNAFRAQELKLKLNSFPQFVPRKSAIRTCHLLGGGFKYVFIFIPLGKWSNLTNIFQLGWNHQLVFQALSFGLSPNGRNPSQGKGSGNFREIPFPPLFQGAFAVSF